VFFAKKVLTGDKDVAGKLIKEDDMVINHNLSAMFASRQNNINSDNVTRDIEKLSSGMRINKGGDDASGLAVSEKLRAQIRGLNQASRNIADGVSFIQTTEGYLNETTSILQRVRELSVQASNGIYTAEDRMQIQVEVSQLIDEVDRIASHAQFNGMNMLTGRFARPAAGGQGADNLFFHVGANMDQREQAYVGSMTADALAVKSTTISTADGANTAIGKMDAALKIVNKQRADLGAYQNRFEEAQKGVDNAAENLQAAESRIRDSDMAKQTVDFVKDQILVQSSNAMLAQANQKTQSVLQLLG
jgi:flagellin